MPFSRSYLRETTRSENFIVWYWYVNIVRFEKHIVIGSLWNPFLCMRCFRGLRRLLQTLMVIAATRYPNAYLWLISSLRMRIWLIARADYCKPWRSIPLRVTRLLQTLTNIGTTHFEGYKQRQRAYAIENPDWLILHYVMLSKVLTAH